jgi:hypothetical protein
MKLIYKLIIWISNLIGWIAYRFPNDGEPFTDYETKFRNMRFGFLISRTVFYPSQDLEINFWFKNFTIWSVHIDAGRVIMYLTLFNKDIYVYN